MLFVPTLAVTICCFISNVHSQQREQQRLDDKADSAYFENRPNLNFSSPSPHLFSSVHGLLRQGYNTFFPNGFAVLPCQIPAFTPLYYGRLDEEAPPSPEWLSFAPEMAYGIMGSTRNSFLSTYQTTRPTKCLYFDGASAALWGSGTLDTQMLLVYGNTTGIPNTNSSRPVSWDEYDRARRLCGWIHEQKAGAPGEGIEGIVRMQAGFELIWCNFSSPSLRLISRLNVSVPLLDYERTSTDAKQLEGPALSSSGFDLLASANLPAPEVGNDWEREPFLASQYWDMLTSASRSYSADDLASYKEPSINILDGDFVNFYSSEYQVFARTIAEQEKEQLNLTSDGFWKGVHSQEEKGDALKRLMRRRSKHRVGNLSQSETARFQQSMRRIVSTLSQPAERVSNSNHMDRTILWSAIHDRVVNNYSKCLLQFRQLLEQDHDAWTGSWITAKKSFRLLRERAHAFLMPYLEYPANPHLEFSSEQESRIRKQSQERCKSAYMPWPAYSTIPRGEPPSLMDHPIGQAFEEVIDGICSVLISIGYSIEKEWGRTFNRIPDEDDEWEEAPLQARLLAWQDAIEELTAWLGWAPHWTRCNKLCDWDEECYIPIWPVFRQMRIDKPVYSNFSYLDPEVLERELWHPKCLKITDFPIKR